MKIIKVDAIDSTNSFLKKAVQNGTVKDTTCVVAKMQTKGRGQMGAVWQVEPGENLTFSVFFKPNFNFQENLFALSLVTTISIYQVLKSLPITKLHIKWPNDILSDGKKIGGVLIENSFKNNQLEGVIVGIGLNVNQLSFDDLPKASSLKKLTGIHYSLDELLNALLISLEEKYLRYTKNDFTQLKNNFESYLFRNKKPSTFKAEGQYFTGIIQGVSNSGKLLVLQEDEKLFEYDLKQIELMY